MTEQPVSDEGVADVPEVIEDEVVLDPGTIEIDDLDEVPDDDD